MKDIFYDVEVFNDFFLAIFYTDGTTYAFCISNTCDDRQQLFSFLKQNASHNFIGFNNYNFDNHILNVVIGAPAMTPGNILKALKSLSNSIVEGTLKVFPDALRGVRHNYDVSILHTAVKPSLKGLALANRYDDIRECPVPFDARTTTEAEKESIKNYCINDTVMTKVLWALPVVQDAKKARTALAAKYNVPAFKAYSRSENSLSAIVLAKLIGNYTKQPPILAYDVASLIDPRIEFKTPQLQEVKERVAAWVFPDTDKASVEVCLGNLPIKIGRGGIHAAVKPFALKEGEAYILDMDVKSYYPNIICNLNLSPDGTHQYSKAFKELLALRKTAVTKEESAAYKLVANAATGGLKSEYSLFYSPRCNDAMTINGQLILLELAEALHVAGIVITQLNTDGCSVYIQNNPAQEALVKEIGVAWEQKWGFTLEYNTFVNGIFEDVNNYTATYRELDRDIKTKGALFTAHIGKLLTNQYVAVARHAVFRIRFGEHGDTAFTSVLDYTTFAKRAEWIIEGDSPGDDFNMSGYNRVYKSKTLKNKLKGVFANGREVSNFENVGSINTLDNTSIADIDFEWYQKEAETIANEFTSTTPTYDSIVYFPKKKIIKKSKREHETFRNWLCASKLVEEGHTRGTCPVCEGENRLVDYGSQWWCFSCRKSITSNDIK